jgi:hypothetical protein
MSKGRKSPDKKYLSQLDPFMSFKVPHPHFHEGGTTKGMAKISMAEIGKEDQSIPTIDTKNKINSTKGAVMGLRMPYSDDDENKRNTNSLIHDKKKGIKDTLTGDCPGAFRARQFDRMRGFKQAKTADATGDLWLIKHNPVKWDHDPFYQKFEPRERVD